jgi:hypothetical protein
MSPVRVVTTGRRRTGERYPYADDNEVRMRVGVLRVGPQLIADAFGWTDPATKG